MIRVKLKRGEDRRIRAGHLWVFSNEVDKIEAGSEAVTPGVLAQLVAASGEAIGVGYYNRNSLIAFRLLSRDADADPSGVISGGIQRALAFRQRLSAETVYRLVYSEGDLLPGLIVDRYHDHLVVQTLSAGMEVLQPVILDELEKALSPKAIVLRNDSPIRTLEGLPLESKVIRGNLSGPISVQMDGISLKLDLAGGQKTGFFLDQRENRLALGRFARERKVLDLFSYTGGWGLYALAAGAASVTAVDVSRDALALAAETANENGFASRFSAREGDCFEVLHQMGDAGERYDVIVVDPPAFARTKKDNKQARIAYERVNKLAVRLLAPGGILASSSCSYHVGREEFLECLTRALASQGRAARVLEVRGQATDHAWLLAMPEGAYLKCVFLHVP